MLLQENPVRAHRVRLAGIPVSEVCFGTEHINRSVPEFGAGILEDAARLHGITFWDTDNAYGSQTQVAAPCAASPGRRSPSPPRRTAAPARRRSTI